MRLHTAVTLTDRVATVTLVGEADSETSVQLGLALEEVARHPVRELRMDMSELTYLSSAGLRCIVYAHQQLGRGVRIVLLGTSREVAETIKLAGFHRSITMQERPRT